MVKPLLQLQDFWGLWYFDSATIIAPIHHRFCCNSDMISKICCCNGAATHTGFLVYYIAAICWFSMLENTYANRLFYFYPFFHSICEDK